jgi:hypothetical protein
MPRHANPPPVFHPQPVAVDPAQHSAAYKLFHHRYHCITAQMNLYSKAYLEISGMVSTGDKNADRAMAHAPAQCWLTPAAMAEFLEQGATFAIKEPKETVEIYENINQHLQDWKNHVQKELNTSDVPWEDLRKFEALAVEVFKIARGFMARSHPMQSFFNRVGGGVMRGLSREAPKLDHNNQPIITPRGEIAAPAAHTPVVDAMRKEMQQLDTGLVKKPNKPWLTGG